MGLSNFSVNRPVAIVMIVLAIMLIAIVSLSNLSIDLFPEMNFPIAIVVTSYQGAAPSEVENMISRPLEEMLGTVENVTDISSISSMGSSVLILHFETGTDLNFATLQMRERIDIVKGRLPSGVSDPMVMKLDFNAMPVLMMGIGGNRPLDELEDIARDTIRPRIERLEGVASVDISGGLTREIQVIVEPEKLAAHGLDISSVIQALQAQNLNLSAGLATRGGQEMALRVIGEYSDVAQIASSSLRTPAGATIRLDDVARIEDGYKDIRGFDRANDQVCIAISVQKQSGANTVAVVRDTHRVLANLAPLLPEDVNIFVVMDQAEFIEFSIQGITNSLIKGGLLAVAVLFIFLRSFRSTIVVAISMPISVISTFILVYFGGLSLNMMTMGGLALGVGLMVDCSIVVLENIFRFRERGQAPIEAAKSGANEVSNAIIASILTTIAVFFPLFYVEGLASEIFSDLALTVSFSLLSSLLVALTLIPMLASRLLKGDVEKEKKAELKPPGILKRMVSSTEKWFQALDRAYRSLLNLCLRQRLITVIIVVILVAAVIPLIPAIGMEFLPTMDQGMIIVDISLPLGSRMDEVDKVVKEVEKVFQHFSDEIDLIYSSIGNSGADAMGGMMGGGGQGSNEGSMYIALLPLVERKTSSAEVVEYARREVLTIPGAEINISVADMTAGMTGSDPISLDIKGNDLQQLAILSAQVTELLRGVPGTREVNNSLESRQAELQLIIDREKAIAYGLSAAQIATSVRVSVDGQVATRFRTGSEEVDIRVRTGEEGSKEVVALENMLLASPLGFMVPLGEVAEIREVQAPSTIRRDNQSRVVSVTAQLELGYDLSRVMTEVQRVMERNVFLPTGYTMDYGGEFDLMTEAFGDLKLALLMAIVLVYMILAALFESLLYPFVIMFSLPVAVIGVVLILFLTGTTFNIVTFIGIIILAGIVTNNAIVLVYYINQLRQRGLARDDAILTAGPIRLRPILMTAISTIFAMIPLALGTGEGSEMQISLAIAVIGGLTTSTFLTLLFVPVVYSLLDELRRLMTGNKDVSADIAGDTAS